MTASPPDPAPRQEELTALMERVSALESAPPAEPRVPAALAKQMELLMGKVASLERAPAGGTDHDLEAITAQVNRLTAEVVTLRAVPKRVEAIERVQGRVNAMEKSLATLSRSVGDLSAKVAAPAPAPVATSVPPETVARMEAFDAVLAELVGAVGQLSSRMAALDEVPKRVEALEQSTSPTEKLVASLAKRIDRLSTQAASLKELPERVEAMERAMSADRRWEEAAQQIKEVAGDVGALGSALEGLTPRLRALEEAAVAAEAQPSPDRSDALATGLGHAIDMIDQLSHQVAVLEERALAPERSAG